MSELTFEQMLEESFKTIHTGEVVEGTVIDVKPDEIILNIGYKSDGVLTRNEYTNEPNVDLTTVAKPGDTMEVKVLKVNDGDGQVLLTYKRLAIDRGTKRIEEAYNNRAVLKAKVDVMIVIGGKHSSNTRKLYEICMPECANTYFIQTLDDLHLDLPKSVRLVGITAGASTPNNIIEEVQNYVRINF